MKILTIFAIIGLFFATISFSQTEVSGLINENTTWNYISSPYILTDNLVINTGITLTIEPGVAVRINSSKSIIVKGMINATGTEIDSIEITRNTTDRWGTIRFQDTSSGIFKYCKINWAGESGLSAVSADSIVVQNSTICNNTGNGIYNKDKSSPSPSYIMGNNIFDNSEYGISTGYGEVFFIKNNKIFNNNKGGIWYRGNPKIIGNSIYNNFGYGINSIQGSPMIIGNVFYNNSDGNIYWRHGSSFIANNTIYCNTSHSISFDNVGNDTISFNNFISSNYSIYYGSDYGSPPDIYASNNFWGTMNKDSIAIQIWDIFDNYNLGIVIYEPFLNCPVKDAPGFLYQVEINPAPPIKCGLYTFNLIFSKPMDINVQPLVTFGIYYPYLQNIIEGGWIDSTLWQGTYEFNMMTGDGINYLNVTKSKDCNDIEIPEDMRFSFVVDVKGVGIIKDVLILDRFFLYQNYPNPFNPTTTISYQLPKSSFVKLAIYDINGRLIETLVNENRNSGYYTVGWTADKVCSGIYFYRIDAGEFTCVKKCLVVK